MKLKETTSLSDSEHLNFLENDENNPSKIAQINLSDMRTPFKDTEMSVLSLGSPRPSVTDPANHDKIYYDDRFNGTGFDPFLARSSLPKIMISIGGMLLTSFFLNIIIVRPFVLVRVFIFVVFVDLDGVYKCTRIVRTRSSNLQFKRHSGTRLNISTIQSIPNWSDAKY